MAALFGPEIARNTVEWCRIISMLAVILGICGAAYFTAGISWGENSKTHLTRTGAAHRYLSAIQYLLWV